jgi:uncharacterized membrane protein YfcA
MEDAVAETAKLASVGLGTGFIAGVLGVGGGAILVPSLAMLLPHRIQNHKQALGTSLCAMVPVGAVGAFTHYRLGNIPKPATIALPLAIGCAAGSFLGARFVAGRTDDDQLRLLFGVLIGGMGGRSLLGAFK